jgi:hypothetical protein
MGVRAYATEITGQYLSNASNAFRENPSCDNWMILDKAMKAHQVASLAIEETVDLLLAQVPKLEIVNELAKHFDDIQEIVERACESGHVQLIKSKAA